MCSDRFNKAKLLISADLGRTLAVFSLPLVSMFSTLQLWHLMLVAAIVGALTSIFEPVLLTCLPRLVSRPQDLPAANGLADMAQRLARAIGPGFAGLLISIMPLYQFFSIDALTFIAQQQRCCL
jgi:MFS family permease